MKKKICLSFLILVLFCMPLMLMACSNEPSSSQSLANPPKYIGFTIDETTQQATPLSTKIKRANIVALSETVNDPIEIMPEEDLTVILLYENDKRDMIVDVIVNDSVKGNNQVYSSTSQNNKIESIETVYSDERNTWITEVALIIKSDNTPVNDRTIEVKETTFLRNMIEGIADVDNEADNEIVYTVLSKMDIGNGATLYGQLDSTINVEYIIDDIRDGDIESYTFGDSITKKVVSVVSNKQAVSVGAVTSSGVEFYNYGEYFDGWYLDNSLIGKKASTIVKETSITLYGQIIHGFFDQELEIMTYSPASDYGDYDGYAVHFTENINYKSPDALTFPNVANGKRITVLAGFQKWKTLDEGGPVRYGWSANIIISDGLQLIAEKALRGSYETLTFLGERPIIMSGNYNYDSINP